ncbi:uncharacterized protein LOC119658094 [Hermetia illucens]|nr:uncharacterized protein LOC119658094 [Hermetia illucens]
MAVDENMGFLQKDILDEVLTEIDHSLWYLNHDDGLQEKSLRYNNIVMVDSHEAFRIILHQLQIAHIYDSTGHYVIVLHSKVGNDSVTIEKILADCARVAITNVNILIESMWSTIDFYTYYPYTRLHCNNTAPILINSFVNGSMVLDIDLFPKKITNLHKCPLRVITWVNPPFIFMEYRSDGSLRFYGSEGGILDQLSVKFNFTIRHIPAPAENPRGFIFDNGSMTGTFEMLKNGVADLTLGCFRYSEQRVRHFASTYSYYQVPIVVAIPQGISYTALERLFYPFSDAVWFWILVVFLIAAFLIVVLRYFAKRPVESFIIGSNNRTPIYNMLISALGGQVNHPPNRTFARFILLKWLILTLVLRGTYQGILYDFIRSNTEKKLPSTFAELADAGYTIHTDPPTEDIAFANKDLKRIYTVSVESQHAYLLRLQKGLPKAGILLPRDYVAYFNSVHYKGGPLHILKERVLVQPNCIYFQKHSFLAKPMNDIVLMFSTGGLLGKWYNDFTEIKYSLHGSRPSASQFSNEQLSGAYEIFGALIGVSCLIFVLELLSRYCERLKTVFDVLAK